MKENRKQGAPFQTVTDHHFGYSPDRHLPVSVVETYACGHTDEYEFPYAAATKRRCVQCIGGQPDLYQSHWCR